MAFQTKLRLASQHILQHLTNKRPLFAALQGPQGSGKTSLAAQLRTLLQSPPHSLRVAVLSIDDLYLPHEDLISLSASSNVLWKGRGLPGTHDVDLGLKILSGLESADSTLELPRFDKSLFNGEGDRLPLDGNGTVIVQPPAVDVVILEGWLVGFHPITDDDLEARWHGIWKVEKDKLGLDDERTGCLSDIQAINEKLSGYLRLWNFFDVFIKLQTAPPVSPQLSQYDVVYKWRLEQELYMKETNGGKGMSDADVKTFVDRYIPGYVFFGDLGASSVHPPPKWMGNGLSLCLSESRELVSVETF